MLKSDEIETVNVADGAAKLGSIVFHKKFGEGMILGIDDIVNIGVAVTVKFKHDEWNSFRKIYPGFLSLARPSNIGYDEEIFPRFKASNLDGCEVPGRTSIVEDLIPCGVVTQFSGDGGTGKSQIVLQLAVSVVQGTPWIGRDTATGDVLFVTAEDDADEVHRRLNSIALAAGVDIANEYYGPWSQDGPPVEVTKREKFMDRLRYLTISSLAGRDAVLARADPKSGEVKTTRLFTELELHIGRTRPELVVLDTLANLFGGDENNRSQAMQFINRLNGLAITYETAIVLLSHPSLSGMTSGSGTSGSTAWNNGVRSRLYLERVKDGSGHETDPDVRVLKTMKSNYGPTGGEIKLRWRNGVFVPDTWDAWNKGENIITSAVHTHAETVFLKLLDTYNAEMRYVSPSPSASYAPSHFARDSRSEGVRKPALVEAMNRLLASRAIKVVEYGSKSRSARRIVRTEPCDFAGEDGSEDEGTPE